MRQILTSRLSLSKHLAHNLGNLLLLGKIGVFHNRRNASSRLLLLISKHLILCIYLVFRILACSRRLNASNLFLSLILHLVNLFLIVQLHFSKLFLILKSGVNHTSRGSISTSTFFFQAEDGIRDLTVTGVQTCALPISGVVLVLAIAENIIEDDVPDLLAGNVNGRERRGKKIAHPGVIKNGYRHLTRKFVGSLP